MTYYHTTLPGPARPVRSNRISKRSEVMAWLDRPTSPAGRVALRVQPTRATYWAGSSWQDLSTGPGSRNSFAGRIRTVLTWIGGNDWNPCGADFVPPPPEEVHALLDDLCEAVNRDTLQPLVQAALVHAQFETIHPFDDGNGRTGRALIDPCRPQAARRCAGVRAADQRRAGGEPGPLHRRPDGLSGGADGCLARAFRYHGGPGGTPRLRLSARRSRPGRRVAGPTLRVTERATRGFGGLVDHRRPACATVHGRRRICSTSSPVSKRAGRCERCAAITASFSPPPAAVASAIARSERLSLRPY
jgi:hypothetical protein